MQNVVTPRDHEEYESDASDEDDVDVERGDKKKKNLRKLILSVSCR